MSRAFPSHERAAAAAFLAIIYATEGREQRPDDFENLPEDDRHGLIAVVRAIFAAGSIEAPKPRRRGPLNELDAEALRLDLPDARAVLILALDDRARALGAWSGRNAGSTDIGADVATHLWRTVFARTVEGAAEASSPDQPES